MGIDLDKYSTAGLVLIAVLAFAGAVASAYGHIEAKAIEGIKFFSLLGVAILVILMFRDRLSKVTFLGVLGAELKEVQKDVKELKTLQENLAAPKMEFHAADAAGAVKTLADDPNKGMFGGKAASDGLRLSANVAEVRGQPGDFRVELMVSGTGVELRKPVRFHLHNTFHPQVRTVDPVDGEARLMVIAYGAFTVGAEIGTTRLELDLAADPSFPAAFRAK